MLIAKVTVGAPEWILPAAIGTGCLFVVILWSYSRASGTLPFRLLSGLLKGGAIVAIALCLIEPLFSGTRPRPGANLFIIAADNSQSMQLRDEAAGRTRADQLQAALTDPTGWQTRLSQDFDVRRYTFDSRVQPVADFSQLSYDGKSSALGAALSTVLGRYRERPVAGVLLMTDGNATDFDRESFAGQDGPPIYPVMMGQQTAPRDIRITRVSVTQTNFEASPVTILIEAESTGFPDATIVFQLLNMDGLEIQRHSLRNKTDGDPLAHRFLMRPRDPGISFYRVRVFRRQDEAQLAHPEQVPEATLKNNTRLITVDQGGGPYRVLYVAGNPSWEFKFIRRAMHEDEQVHLVGLVRIAKKEPKFTFRGHMGESTNPLFRGFDNQEDEEAEQYDQPVLLRLGVRDGGEELRDGFPKSAEELFKYDALILDDLDAAFFTQDQMSLIQQFVSDRGGGFLMLGGRSTFASGKYGRTPIGELLPVYLDRPRQRINAADYKLQLTREGWLQPWARLRTNEQDEESRLAEMPRFRTLNQIQSIKPGATVLAYVESPDGQQLPALVVQRFGKGRSAAMLVGDLWRWHMQRPDPSESDLEKSWRQTIRWLVADVPARVDAEIRRKPNDPGDTLEVLVRVRDEEFQPLDNAAVSLEIETPDGKTIDLTAAASDLVAGGYEATMTPRLTGAYRTRVVATGPDGSEVGRRNIGWATEPATHEFQELQPDRTLLEYLAETTGGEVLTLDALPDFVASLPNRKVPITEPWTFPLWHQWSVLALAICGLAGEWGLRRWKGLP